MALIKLPGHIDHKVDFDDFRFEGHAWNWQVATEISSILVSRTNIDELRMLDQSEDRFSSTIGTGSEMDWPVSTQSLQRVLLATHFSSYAKRQYSSCWLTIFEYRCLKNLQDELRDDYVAEHRKSILDSDFSLIHTTCQQFAQEYCRLDPSFLMEVIKEAQE